METIINIVIMLIIIAIPLIIAAATLYKILFIIGFMKSAYSIAKEEEKLRRNY
jgi:hypothetical protein